MPTRPSYAKRPRDITLKRVDPDLVNALAAEAEAEARSLSAQIRYILREHVYARAAQEERRRAPAAGAQ